MMRRHTHLVDLPNVREVDLALCSKIIMTTCLDVKPGERILLLTDTGQSWRLAVSLMSACLQVGGVPVIMMIPPLDYGGQPPKNAIDAAFSSAALLALTSTPITHTDF